MTFATIAFVSATKTASKRQPSEFTERIRKLLEERDLGKNQFDRLLNKKQGYTSRLLSMGRKPTQETLELMAKALEVPVSALFGEEPVPVAGRAGLVDRYKNRGIAAVIAAEIGIQKQAIDDVRKAKLHSPRAVDPSVKAWLRQMLRREDELADPLQLDMPNLPRETREL